MAGKEMYIGRMLEGLEASMDNVANGMAESVSILEQILNNSGLERKNKAYAGQDLVDLAPVFVGAAVLTLDEHTVYTAPNLVYQASYGPELTQSYSTLKIKVGDLRALGVTSLALKLEITAGNDYIKSLFQRWQTSFDYYGYNLVSANGPNGDSTYISDGSLSTSATTQTINQDISISTWLNYPDDREVIFYFKNSWKTDHSGIQIKYSLSAGNQNVFSLGSYDVTDYVYTVSGRGSLTFSINLTGTAGELSDAKIVAVMNESDSIDLLTAAGDVYQADVGLTIPLAQLAALSFKLRFNMSTGSSLSAINVRYY